jgi:hypothetical protein
VAGTTIFSQQGQGNQTTGLFTVPSGTRQWDLAWSFDCPPGSSNPAGFGLGNFSLQVYKGASKDSKDPGATGSGASGQGAQRYSDSGTFSVQVGALLYCTWTLSAVLPGG